MKVSALDGANRIRGGLSPVSGLRKTSGKISPYHRIQGIRAFTSRLNRRYSSPNFSCRISSSARIFSQMPMTMIPSTTNVRFTYTEKRHYFWFGEVGMAAILAGAFAVPLGIFLAGRAEITLAFIGAAVLFLPLFVFLPKLMQKAMRADTDAIIEAFGKNEHVRKVFWTLFAAMAGLVVAQVLDPATAQQVVGIITGRG
jgi:hypothetical protein